MNKVLEEAMQIVEAAFGSLAALVVNGKDPITAAITVKNNTRPAGSTLVGYLLGSYNPDTKVFTCAEVVVGGVDYDLGSAQALNLSTPPAQQTLSVPSYAPDVSAPVTLDMLCFVMPPPPAGAITWLFGDFGQGSRSYGIRRVDLAALWGSMINGTVFQGVITINPAPVIPSVEITAVSVTRN
jgi:hypothetical protein